MRWFFFLVVVNMWSSPCPPFFSLFSTSQINIPLPLRFTSKYKYLSLNLVFWLIIHFLHVPLSPLWYFSFLFRSSSYYFLSCFLFLPILPIHLSVFTKEIEVSITASHYYKYIELLKILLWQKFYFIFYVFVRCVMVFFLLEL